MMGKLKLKGTLFGAIVLLLVGCSQREALAPMMSEVRTLRVIAGGDINVYANTPHPVVLRLYQLTAKEKFENLSFINIFDNNHPELVGEIVARQTLPSIYPNETQIVDVDLVETTRFLAVFAEFADFTQQQFRDVKYVDHTVFEQGINIHIGPSGVTMHAKPSSIAQTKSQVAEQNKGVFTKLKEKLFGIGKASQEPKN